MFGEGISSTMESRECGDHLGVSVANGEIEIAYVKTAKYSVVCTMHRFCTWTCTSDVGNRDIL